MRIPIGYDAYLSAERKFTMYELTEAADLHCIEEREWGIGSEIKFGTFTSCIGVVSKVRFSSDVIGVHLAIEDSMGNQATPMDMNHVWYFLEEHNWDRSSTKVIGCINVWKASNRAAWDRLMYCLEGADEYPLGEGTYGARASGGGVELTD